jgi:hypothetical protein
VRNVVRSRLTFRRQNDLGDLRLDGIACALRSCDEHEFPREIVSAAAASCIRDRSSAFMIRIIRHGVSFRLGR